jgi:serine/threonine protein phosphatase PrpC
MKYGTAEINGRSRSPPSTEDRHFVQSLPGEIIIAGVFDGHGGLSTVVYTINTFPTLLANMIKEVNGDVNLIQSRLKGLFIQHDKNLATKGYIGYRDSGSTATVAIITPSVCIIAHIGDSPACIIDLNSGNVLHKITPHFPSDKKEHDRITKCNGTVTNEEGDAPRVNGMLMVSRAFGDFALKFKDVEVPEMNKNWNTDFCVSSEPDVVIIPRPPRGALAIFSDGLVDTESDKLKPIEEVAKMIVKGIQTASGDYKKGAEAVLKEHVEAASSPYEGDDTTLVIIDISMQSNHPLGGGSHTRKGKKHKKSKKHTMRSSTPEGLKTFLI